MMSRSFVFTLHRYAGLVIGLLLVLSGLSGSVLVFRDEIEALVSPEMRVTTAQGKHVTVDKVLQTVQRAYPDDRPFAIRLPRTPQQTYLIKMNTAHALFVYVDPYSGRILGAHRQKDSAMGWIGLLHTELLGGEAGETALGIGGLLLIGLCVSGVVLWWPRNGKISRGFTLRWSAPWKRLKFDLHRVSGVVMALLLLVVALTGVSLVFNKTVTGLINTLTASLPRSAPPLSSSPGPAAPLYSIDALLREADRVLPAPTTWINLPQTPQAPVTVRKKLPQESHPNGRNFVYLDQYTGRVLQVENALTAPLGTRIANLLYPIHTGAIAGTPTRMLQSAVGLSPLLLFITGLAMWNSRRKGKP